MNVKLIFKRGCLLLFICVSFMILFNQDIITTFAKELLIDDVEYNHVYDYEDKIGIFDDWGDPVTELWVGYLDKDGKLLEMYLAGADMGPAGYNNSAGFKLYNYSYMNYFYLGYTCDAAFTEYFSLEHLTNDWYYGNPDNYEQFLENFEYYKELDCSFDIEKDNSSKDLSSIKRFKLLNTENKTLSHYCELFDINNNYCEDVLTDPGHYNNEYPVMLFQEYVEPEFVFACDSDKVNYGDKVKCNLNINSAEKLTKIRTNIKSEHFEIKGVSAINDWTYEVDNDGFYVLKNDAGFTGDKNVFNIELVAKKNIDIESTINLDEFEYTTLGGFTDKVDLKTDLKVNAMVNNPNTFAFNYFILFVVIASAVGIVFVLKPKNQYEE